MSELVLSEVNRVLEHAKTISLDLSLVTKQAKNPAVLMSVGDVTHSVVRLDPAGDKVSYRCTFLAPRPSAYRFRLLLDQCYLG